MTSAAALLMLAVFAVSILGVLLGGAGIYQRLTLRGHESYNSRTCIQYFATKLRQAPGTVTVEEFGDGDALFLRERIGERDYVTRIYCYDGWLMELFTLDSSGFAPEDGEKILPLEALSITGQQKLLTIQVQCDEMSYTLMVHP